MLLRERGGVDEKVQPAEFLVERRSQIGDLLIVGNVARREQRILELLCELADVFLEPFARIRQRETRAFGRRRLRDRPRDRPLVRDAHDQTVFARESRQVRSQKSEVRSQKSEVGSHF